MKTGFRRWILAAVVLLTGCHPAVVQRGNAPVLPARVGSEAAGTAAQEAVFRDAAPASGLHYRWTVPGKRPLTILQTIGNGCAFLDYNNDGNLDVLLVGIDHVALYKGDGHGRFTDMSHETGLDTLRGHFLGCAVGDYDNDGYDDLYLSGYHTGLLLHNEHGKRFRDVTREAGLAPQPWGTSCAFADIDNGGRLDLYVGNYVLFDKTTPQLCPLSNIPTACSPGVYRPGRGILYHNLGHGKFQDITRRWGAAAVSGYCLGVAFADYDGTGRPSLALANDETYGDLMKNEGKRFKNVGKAAGTATDLRGSVYAGMGIDWGDYDNDGKLDLVLATFEQQTKCVFHNHASLFTEESARLGLDPAVPWVAFGVKWLDFDNDGWLDLILSEGHVMDNVADVNRAFDNADIPGYAKHPSYRQSIQLFHNTAGTRFTDSSSGLDAYAHRPIVGRGLAVGDYDNDGRVDVLVVDSEGVPLLLHNEAKPSGHWLSFTLEGTRSNRDGYGAQVTVQTSTPAGGLTQTRVCHADGSYLSSSDKRVHVGLGTATVADTVRVRWPSGQVDTYHGLKADAAYRVREGDKEARPVGTAPVETPALAR